MKYVYQIILLPCLILLINLNHRSHECCFIYSKAGRKSLFFCKLHLLLNAICISGKFITLMHNGISVYLQCCYLFFFLNNFFPLNCVNTVLQDGQHRLVPQKLYVADNGAKNLSVLSSISILPFSRLFLVGTEDGYLRICC